tara:strand:+ start:567 stop:998 length:432 start_codon:yes stop_codon:yes gene_type:complete
MKIYTKDVITNIDLLKKGCKKMKIDYLFVTDEGFFRLYHDKYYKGRVVEGKHETHMIQFNSYYTDTTFIKFDELVYQLPVPHIAIEKYMFEFKHITVVIEMKKKDIIDAYYESRKTRIQDIQVDIATLPLTLDSNVTIASTES